MDVVRVQLPTKIFLEEPFKVLFEDIVSQAEQMRADDSKEHRTEGVPSDYKADALSIGRIIATHHGHLPHDHHLETLLYCDVDGGSDGKQRRAKFTAT
jgi:hypothetical protein